MRKNNSKKQPSLRESMLGRNIIKKLPDNFFEKVLQCEVSLKKTFNIQILQELIYYYTAAVEYYESIDDPKYKHYSQSLNLLLTQPEIVKNLNGNKNTLNHKLEVKKKLENKDKKETKLKVQTLLKQADSDEAKVLNMKGMISEEMDNQQNIFQKRKEEKKRKFLLSTSDITEAVQTMKNKRQINTQNANKSFDIGDKVNDNDDSTPKKESNNDILKDINKSPTLMSQKKTTRKLNSMKSRNKTTEIIQSNIDKLIVEYESCLKSKVVLNAYRELENVLREKEAEMIETARTYTTQIKESEFLLTSDGNEMYKDQLTKIIFNLQEEEKEESEKIESKYNDKAHAIKDRYNDRNLSLNSSIDLIQNKFKLDIVSDLTTNLL